jgi:hypothetical protein
MNTKPKRNPTEIIDQMIVALGDKKPAGAESLRKLKRDHMFRAPETHGRTWSDMQEILYDEILADTPNDDFSEEQKACIRLFTDNPNIV